MIMGKRLGLNAILLIKIISSLQFLYDYFVLHDKIIDDLLNIVLT